MRKFLILSLLCGSSLMASDTLVEQDGSPTRPSYRIEWAPQAPLRPNSSAYQYWQNRAETDPLIEIRGNSVWVGKKVIVRNHKEKTEN